MLKNYLKIAVRNILRQRIYSIINIIGLAVGIACCIAILLYVRDELSYDRFNKNADQIYRVHYHTYFNNKDFDLANSCAPLEPTMVKDFPEVVAATRIANFGFPVIRYKDKAFSEEKFYEADSTFFNVFTVHFIEGNPGTALVQPYTVVITETTARKYFGNENPMGKILNLDNRQNYIVTGVVKGFPNNAHFHFDFLASLAGNADSRNQIWLSNNYYTYILLHKGTDPSAFEKKLNQDIRKYIGPQLKSATGVTFDQFESAGNRVGFYLQPLTSIHLNSHLDYEIQPNGDVSYVYIFSAIAIAILLIACINFMNLSTARSDRRAREVGIRKALGSRRGQLIMQFMAESIITSLIAVLLSIGIVEMILPLFNNISGKGLSMGIFDKLYTFPLLILFAFVVGITAGSYPAFYLSSFIPVQVLKSDRRKGSRKSLLRSTLVISQFAVSIALFVSTFIVYSQLKYIQEKNLGFDKEQVVVINKTNDLGTQIESFKQELLANPEIRNVSNSNAIPGNQYGDDVFQPEGGKANDAQNIRTMSCDYDFAKVYRIEMAAGRFFSLDHPSDTTAVVMNEAALKVLGIKDPVGKNLVAVKINPANSRRFEIIGVTKDFNYESLHQVVRPLVINLFGSNGSGKFISVRIAPGDH
jgi:putative ABC transport system permease protein